MFEELSAKELIRKTRLEVREAIRESAKEIKKQERNLQARRLDLKNAQAVRNGDKAMLQLLESSIRGLEDGLSQLKANHARHVAFQSQPNPAFPNGITFEQFTL